MFHIRNFGTGDLACHKPCHRGNIFYLGHDGKVQVFATERDAERFIARRIAVCDARGQHPARNTYCIERIP